MFRKFGEPKWQGGERNLNSKFTVEQVKFIRDEYAHGSSIPWLAQRHSVDYKTIEAIVKRKTWKDV